MLLRARVRWKDGTQQRYWSVVESRRVAGKRVVQRPLIEATRSSLIETTYERNQGPFSAIDVPKR